MTILDERRCFAGSIPGCRQDLQSSACYESDRIHSATCTMGVMNAYAENAMMEFEMGWFALIHVEAIHRTTPFSRAQRFLANFGGQLQSRR